jgi:hypothetical protein
VWRLLQRRINETLASVRISDLTVQGAGEEAALAGLGATL